MQADSFNFWQLVLNGIGLTALIAYVIYTARLFKSSQENLREVRQTNQRHDEEFRISMRPWIGFEEVKTTLDKDSNLRFECYIRNFGSSPAVKSEIHYYCSHRADVFSHNNSIFSEFTLLPGARKGLMISRRCDWVTSDSSNVYMLLMATYESPFGSHWCRELIRVHVGENRYAMELFQIGEATPPDIRIAEKIAIGEGMHQIVQQGLVNIISPQDNH